MKNEPELKMHCNILKRIASRYPDESQEVLTLKKAAVAMQLIFLKRLGTELEKMLEQSDKPLMKAQIANLKRMGVERAPNQAVHRTRPRRAR